MVPFWYIECCGKGRAAIAGEVARAVSIDDPRVPDNVVSIAKHHKNPFILYMGKQIFNVPLSINVPMSFG
jgi:hypothetical protein